MAKYDGELAGLRDIVEGIDYQGEWTESDGKHVFRSKDGAILNWWPSTKTMQFQRTREIKNRLEEAIQNHYKMMCRVSHTLTLALHQILT